MCNTNRKMKMHKLGKAFCFLSKPGVRRQPLVVGESEGKDREQKDCSIYAFSSRGWYKGFFIDRDGILNHVVMRENIVSSPYHIKEFRLIPEAVELVNVVKKRGFLTIMITNQPDVARGKISRHQLSKIHKKLQEEVALDHLEICTSADDSYYRRKPNPGMLIQSARKWNISLKDSLFLGDSKKDIEAGKRAGVKTILYQTDYNKESHGMADYNCDSFEEIITTVNHEIY